MIGASYLVGLSRPLQLGGSLSAITTTIIRGHKYKDKDNDKDYDVDKVPSSAVTRVFLGNNNNNDVYVFVFAVVFVVVFVVAFVVVFVIVIIFVFVPLTSARPVPVTRGFLGNNNNNKDNISCSKTTTIAIAKLGSYTELYCLKNNHILSTKILGQSVIRLDIYNFIILHGGFLLCFRPR